MKRKITSALLLTSVIGCGPAGQNPSVSNNEPQKPQTTIDAIDDVAPVEPSETQFSPDNFVNEVTNPYFSIIPGRKYSYTGKDPRGVKVQKELLATDARKEILGISTQAIWEREWQDENLVNDTKKWYAQDKEGNVWLFGEEELKIFGGYIQKEGNSWEAGKANATAGIVVPADPNVGDKLNREFDGFVKQSSEIIALNQAIDVPGGQYKDCMGIKEQVVGDAEKVDHSFYCRDLGNEAREVIPDTFGKIDLTRIEDNFPTIGMHKAYEKLKVEITQDEAKKSALKTVPDAIQIANVSLALKDGKPAYLVEIVRENKKIVPVYVNITSGSVIK